VVEYPLALVAACLLRPWPEESSPRARRLDWALPLGLGVLLLAAGMILRPYVAGAGAIGKMLLLMPAGLVCLSFSLRPLRFGLALLAMVGVGWVVQPRPLDAERSFFGIHRVRDVGTPPHRYRFLYHGATLHGAESLLPARRGEPLTYYHRTGPLGQLFAALADSPRRRRVAVVGLGVGTIAAYGRAGDAYDFYEIDPLVEGIARRHFSFLGGSPARISVILGDARLRLRDTRSTYGIIVLDAFSSDAIPVHLMTREALQLYLERLEPGGVLAFHISNRYLELDRVLGGLAREAGLVALDQYERRIDERDGNALKRASRWVVVARDRAALEPLLGDRRWQPLPGPQTRRTLIWTDDFSDILRVLF
jgi:SAM-dependent methyltransferase